MPNKYQPDFEIKQARKFTLGNKNRVRNLRQYKEMTDNEFDQVWETMQMDVAPSAQLEKRIDLKLAEFANDYDLDDLKINDKLVLRALVQSIIQLEDLEQVSYRLRQDGIKEDNVAFIREINSMSTDLRKSISSLQEDLRITRKLRKGDKEQSVLTYLEELKTKAKQFYQSKMSYIWCPKCKMLLGTIWTQYPEEKKNKIKLICNRKDDSGNECGEEIQIGTKELLEMGGVNISDVPEFYK